MNENSICEFWHQAGAIPGVDYCPEAQTFADVMPRAHLWLCPVCRRGQYLQCAAAGSWLPLPEPCARRRLRTVATRFAGELRAASSVESHTNTRAAAPEPPPEQRGFWAALAKVWPTTTEQRRWVHKTANVLDKLPKNK